ncbi:hypothetical protein FO440_04085 [Mucilaginibacter corticis]|uniref:DUF4450 domain-containing protein n=1 Tax=Mucilaginibacter corticis TaxID=2597670 RepID=A0A556MU82_9SPHI|nr:hypothetical protein [Mucilaginibacter corticis]TSJ43382.1 hypothetical protein FO440_04085 [Mucilaginibacter corticis]
MKKLSLLIILFFTAAISHAQTATIDSTDVKFKKVLDDGQMVFTMPPGFGATPIVKNRQMHYEFAIKSIDKPYEIRYSIAPMTIKALADMYARDKSKEELTAKTLSMTVALNVGGGGWDPTMGFGPFPPQSVKSEFGADWGGTWFINVKNNSFGTEYKYCGMTTLHKSGVADAYIMYLCNSKEDLITLMKENMKIDGLFYALKFKQ